MIRNKSITGWYKNWYFRSLKELSYAIKLDDEGKSWKSAETSEFRVEYTDVRNNVKKHWPDFVVEDKLIVEIKPACKINNKSVQLKADAMKQWCLEHGYEYQIITPRVLSSKRLQELIDSKIVVLQEASVKRCKAYIKRRSKKNESRNSGRSRCGKNNTS